MDALKAQITALSDDQWQGLLAWVVGAERDRRLALPLIEEPPAEDPVVEEFVQPTGAHDAYAIGDRVRFDGHTYRSLIDGNAYSPAAYPQGWEKET